MEENVTELVFLLTEGRKNLGLKSAILRHFLPKLYTLFACVFSRSEEKLPGVDIFVCTADPKMEPPTLVINTVLSAMSYNYPPEKLSVYLSDDGGSELTFYALVEATRFCKHWIPFCKKFRVEPRSPAAYFAQHSNVPDDIPSPHDWLAIKVRNKFMYWLGS